MKDCKIVRWGEDDPDWVFCTTHHVAFTDNLDCKICPVGIMEWSETKFKTELDELKKAKKYPDYIVRSLVKALAFYADPGTYHAIALLPDPPCGEFMEDFSEVEEYNGGCKPGKKAREALEWGAEEEEKLFPLLEVSSEV